MQEAVVVMFSGGLDSTATLRHFLRETDWIVHAHHVSIRNEVAPRWEAEDAACAMIVEYLRREERPFGFSTSRFDWPFEFHTGWDTDLVVLLGSRVIPNLIGDRMHLALGWVDDDKIPAYQWERQQRGCAKQLWNSCRYNMTEVQRERTSPDLLTPCYDRRKADLMRELPRDLVGLTWSCRKPRRLTQATIEGGESRMFVPCGECHSCRTRYAAMEEVRC